MHSALPAILASFALIHFANIVHALSHFSPRSSSFYGQPAELISRAYPKLDNSMTRRGLHYRPHIRSLAQRPKLLPRKVPPGSTKALNEVLQKHSSGDPDQEAEELEQMAQHPSQSSFATLIDLEINKGMTEQNIKSRYDNSQTWAKNFHKMRLKEFRARKLPTKSIQRFRKATESYDVAFDRYFDVILHRIRERDREKETDFKIPAHRGKMTDQTSDSDSDSDGPGTPVRGKKGKKGKKSKGGGSGSTVRKGFLN